jgi:hypothetical protein
MNDILASSMGSRMNPESVSDQNFEHFMTEIAYGEIAMFKLSELEGNSARGTSITAADLAILSDRIKGDAFIVYYPSSGQSVSSCAREAVALFDAAPVQMPVVFKHNSDVFVVDGDTRVEDIVRAFEEKHGPIARPPRPAISQEPVGTTLSEFELMQAYGKIERIELGANAKTRSARAEFILPDREIAALGIPAEVQAVTHLILSSGATVPGAIKEAQNIIAISPDQAPVVFKHNSNVFIVYPGDREAEVTARGTR